MNNEPEQVTHPAITGEDRLPGDPDPKTLVERMIRVDHAGEFGAARIYEGQLAVLGRRPIGDTIRHMAAQEQKHLDAFDKLIAERRVRPTVLSPVWNAAGFALGAATAAMGERAAMACTVARPPAPASAKRRAPASAERREGRAVASQSAGTRPIVCA